MFQVIFVDIMTICLCAYKHCILIKLVPFVYVVLKRYEKYSMKWLAE